MLIKAFTLEEPALMYNPPKIIKNPRLPVVVIAGGAGFLGSHLSELLLSYNFRVVVIDNMITGNKKFVSHLTSHPRFAFIEHNLNLGLPEKVESADGVIHLLGSELYLSGPEEINLDSLLTNSLSTYHLLELTKQCQAKFLIASSLNVYQGIVASASLNRYFGATPEDERAFSHNEAKRYAESLAWEYFKKFSLDIRVVRLPEIYGPRMDFQSTSQLGRLLGDLVQGNGLTIFGDGLDKDFYLYVGEASAGLFEAFNKPKTAGKIFNLCDSKPVAQLELAYLLKSFGPSSTRLIFKPAAKLKSLTHEIKEIDNENLKEINFKQKVKIREGLRLTLDFLGYSKNKFENKEVAATGAAPIIVTKVPEGMFNKSVKTSSLKEKGESKIKFNRKNFLYVFLAAALFFAPFVFIPPLTISYNLGRSYFEFKALEKDLNNLNFNKAIKDSQLLSQSFDGSHDALANTFLPSGFKNSYLHLTAGLSYTARAISNLISGVGPTSAYLENLAPDAAPSPAGSYPYLEANNGASLINNALDSLSLSEAELSDPSRESLPKPLKSFSVKLLGNIETLKIAAASLKGLVQITPELLGFDNQKNYLVLLQNSNELRPTGGFIGSLVKISARGGRLLNPEIKDIYEIDGRIDEGKINILAPKILKDNFKTVFLHIRDANYDVAFPQSSQKIKTLYETVTGEKIDGIIAIDLGFVKSLITVLGPIFLSTYNETLTGENLFERVQFHSEANFSPGSSGKKTFLSALGQKFFEQLLTLPKDKYMAMAKAAFETLEEKHALVDLYLPSATFLSNLGFNGDIKTVKDDYLMVVDSNLGANKANYYVKRSLGYEVERANREGEVSSILTVSYNHTGTSNAWPGGPYKNYLKVFLPTKASLSKAEVLGNNGNDEDISHQVEIDEEGGKTTFAYFFELPVNTKTSVVFRYVLPPGVFSLNQKNYNLYVQKQPGTQGDPFRAKFVLPFGSDVDNNLNQGFTRQGNSVIFEGNLRKDLNLSIPLSDK